MSTKYFSLRIYNKNGKNCTAYIKTPFTFIKEESGKLVKCKTSEEAVGIMTDDEEHVVYILGLTQQFPTDSRVERGTLQNISEKVYNSMTTNDTSEIVNEDTSVVDKDDISYKQGIVVNEMSKKCNTAIESGLDIRLSDGNVHHFDLTLTDQINMLAIASEVANYSDRELFPYHSSGQPSRFYSKNDMELIINMSNIYRNYHLTYFNALKQYIIAVEDLTTLNSITYGMDIPEEYITETYKALKEVAVQYGII